MSPELTNPSSHQHTPAVTPYAELLGSPKPPNLDALTASQEKEKDLRVEELFAPRLTKSEAQNPDREEDESERVAYYTRLLLGEVSVDAQTESTSWEESSESEKNEEKFLKQPPADEAKQAAHSRLLSAESRDKVIEAIMDKHLHGVQGMARVEALRTNESLRYELGSYLLKDKMEDTVRNQPHAMPRRVSVNGQKSPAHLGYRHLGYMTSREYSAVLAMSMLDGTFVDPSAYDPILENPDRPDEPRGQHRKAAMILLDSPAVSYA